MRDKLAIEISEISKRYISANGLENEVLSKLSFCVDKGEIVSIVGSNGSGKSTLLGILSGLVKPSNGSIQIQGRMVSILENGSNFHPDLTGEENAELFFKLNRVPKKEIPALIKKAKDFSGLDNFFENSIKYYSQGMFVRLAVSTAFLIDADIYLFDEVLSVGDDAFRKKIDLLIQDFIGKGKSIIFASHNKQEVVNLSKRTIWLEKGNILMDDKPQLVMPAYAKFQRQRFEKDIEDSEYNNQSEVLLPVEGEDSVHLNFQVGEYGNTEIELKQIEIKGLNEKQIFREEELLFKITVIKKKPEYGISCQIKVKDEFDQSVFFSLSIYNLDESNLAEKTNNYQGELCYTCFLPKKFLSSGTYFLSLFFGKDSENGPVYSERLYHFPRLVAFKVQSKHFEFISDPEHFSVNPALDWKLERLT